ncbi:Protein ACCUMULATION AND REPLICATION OF CHLOROPLASTS 3 [Abeliophyllum distichum]|uniref:Protein ACCUMULATION AND REPLICATION OF CHLOROPLASTS 3 n=1 Tax=Abeliophyllum distichum TaxID=126358 RepID=A0ABD1VVA3_9LAMI
MNLFYPISRNPHVVSHASIFPFRSIHDSQRKLQTRLRLRLECNSKPIRVELNSDAISTNDSLAEFNKSNSIWEESEYVEVIGIGSRTDAVLDFCSGSPNISPTLRFWNILRKDSIKVQLKQRFSTQDNTPRTVEVPTTLQSCHKAVILVASAAYGSDHITALDILRIIKSGNGFVICVILKPFRFEGQRRQYEVKDLEDKLQKHANLGIVVDTDTLLENDLVTLDEALKTYNNAVLMAVNAISVLVSEKHVKLLNETRNDTEELKLPEFRKIVDGFKEARIGFGAGYNLKSSILQAIYDCPFLGVDLKDTNGVILCIFASSGVVDSSNVNIILHSFRQTMQCQGKIITSIVHEPNLQPDIILTTVIAFGYSRQQLARKNGMFSNLAQHFPFIFNIFKKQYPQPFNTEHPHSSEVTNSPDIGEMPDINSLDGKTEDAGIYLDDFQTLLSNNSEEISSLSIGSGESGVECSLADSYSSTYIFDSEGVPMFKRELLSRGNLRSGHPSECAKEGTNFSEETVLVDNVCIQKLPVGVKHFEQLEDSVLASNTIQEGERVDDNKKTQPLAMSSVSWSRFTDAGFHTVADFNNNASVIEKGNSVSNSKKQGVLSIRAASMLEAERDSEKNWSPIVEMKYREGIYRGRIQGGLPEGKGRLLLGDGSIYDGMWRYGKRSGLGTFCFNNGDVFKGSWRDDVMHGKGWFYFHTGDRWFVNFWKGKANGEGRFYSRLGDVFFGHFKDGWRHGDFLRINVDGTRFHEIWDEGVLISHKKVDSDAGAG